jgi:hypothetical protein
MHSIIISVLFCFMAFSAFTQDISEHRWENRLILILTDAPDQTIYEQQIAVFGKKKEGMTERKLLVYHLLPDQYRTGLSLDGEWSKGNDLYQDYKKTEAPFEVLLIGLDGGVKLRQTELLTAEKLFGQIDQMPMRRAEMRNRGL